TIRRVDAVVLGLGLGAAAGISPGPLLVLVVTAALRSGRRAGVLVAGAPLLSDALVVAVVLLVLGRLPDGVLPWLAMVGALVVAWMGASTVREARTATLVPAGAVARDADWRELRRAVAVNVLSPHPWVFWATVLGPMTVTAWRDGPPAAVGLVGAFYGAMVAVKVVIALVVARWRHRLAERGYRRALVAGGVLLVVTAVLLAVEFAPAAFG